MVTTALAVTGCTTVVDGTAQPDPSAAVRLDTGGYPTVPREVPERTDPNDRRVQASYELSGHLIAPTEIDAAYDWLSSTAQTPVFASEIALTLQFGGVHAAALHAGDTFVGGAISARQTEVAGTANATTPRMSTMLFRYRTADNAAGAVRGLKTLPTAGGTPLDGYPESFRGAAIDAAGLTTVWWTPVGDYLLGVGFASVPDADARTRAIQWLDRQVRELTRITASPQQLLELPPDRDGIMSLTVPGTQRFQDGAQVTLAYLTSRAWANAASGRWTTKTTLFERAGVDLIGSAASVVYRTRDAAAAGYLSDALNTPQPGVELSNETDDQVVAAAPSGVPNVRCSSSTTRVTGDPRKAYSCALVVGRYYVQTDLVSTLAQAQQQASASYLMVKDAK